MSELLQQHTVAELAAALDADVCGIYVIDLPGAPRALSIRDDEEQMREQYREYGERYADETSDLIPFSGTDIPFIGFSEENERDR